MQVLIVLVISFTMKRIRNRFHLFLFLCYAIVQDQIKQKKEAAQFLESGNPFHKNLCEKRSI